MCVTMKREHTFHQSWINTYFECPEQARYIHTGTYPVDETEAAAKGTAVHAAIQAVIQDLASYDEALQVALDTFRGLAELPGFRFVQTLNQSTCEKHIHTAFRTWWDQLLPTLAPTVWCEEQFKFLLYSDYKRDIWLAGTVDYADRNGVKDWKFSMNRDKYGARDGWKLKRFGVQPTAYAAAAYEAGLYGPDEEVPFQFVCIHPANGKVQTLDCPRTIQHVDWFREQCVSIAEQIEADQPRWALRDQSALCSPDWCRAWASCKGKYLGQPVSVTGMA